MPGTSGSRTVLLLMDFQHGVVESLGDPRQALVTTADEWVAAL